MLQLIFQAKSQDVAHNNRSEKKKKKKKADIWAAQIMRHLKVVAEYDIKLTISKNSAGVK